MVIAVKDLDINQRIRDREVRVIDEDGTQLGIMSSYDALRIADEKGLDLVKISPQLVPPVCKIMDYGKFKFDQSKKQKEAKRNQHVNELKEMWLSMTIEQHDLETKANIVNKFLAAGDKVKVSIRMKGRQQAHPEIGANVMNKFAVLCQEHGTPEKKPSFEGRNILMILNPNKKEK